MNTRFLPAPILVLASLLLAGCSGGGGGGSAAAPATGTALVKVATSGTLPPGVTIGGILAHVGGPASGLTITDADVAATGAASGALIVPNITSAVVVGVISGAGIQTGEFATLTYHFATGAAPQAGDFSIGAGASVIDTVNGAAIPGVTVTIQGVSIQ
jgi:hypothetical protein